MGWQDSCCPCTKTEGHSRAHVGLWALTLPFPPLSDGKMQEKAQALLPVSSGWLNKAQWRKTTTACFSPVEVSHSSGNHTVRKGGTSFPPLVKDKPFSCSEGLLCLSTSTLAFSRLEGSCVYKAQAVIGKVCQDRRNEDTTSTGKPRHA